MFQSLSPGVVKTDFLISSGTKIVTPEVMYSNNPHLFPKDIADAVMFVLGCPPHVQVSGKFCYMTVRLWLNRINVQSVSKVSQCPNIANAMTIMNDLLTHWCLNLKFQHQ
jgi:hypothetical protein